MKATQLIFVAATALAGLASSWSAQAEAPYPSQPIKFVIPASAGGLPDTLARIVGHRLQERMKQTVVIENRPGGNASIAAVAITTSAPDGYTFMVQDGSVVSINPLIYAKLAYNPNDLAAVSSIARAPLFLAVHPKVPVATMEEFVAYVKARPGQLNYGSSGVGSTHHLTMEGIKAALKLEITHIPYKGTGESVPALLGGHVEAAFSAYPSLGGAVGTKAITIIATSSAHPSALAPKVPPVADMIPGFDLAPTIGVYARRGTPTEVMEKVAQEIAAIVREPDVMKQLAAAGAEPLGGGPDDFARTLQSEIERFTKIVQTIGMRPQ